MRCRLPGIGALLESRLSRHFSAVGYEELVQTATGSVSDQVFLITGSTDGIGKQTAAALASRGATVLVAGRHRWKVQRTLRDLRGHTGNRRVFGYCYDLRSFEQTRAFAQHIKQDLQQHFNGRLTALVNNAGVFNEEQVFTEDGLEETWQVNVAAPFLLTAELLPDITSRIINISSISLADEMDWGNLQGEQEYGRVGHQAYALSKLALNMWSYQLAARLHRAHHPAVAHLVDPGAVATKILLAGWGEVAHGVAMRADQSADIEWALTEPSLSRCTGRYYVNRKPRLSPKVSYDLEAQQRLWDLLTEQTGATFDM